ncbi:hypothetical protein FXB39_21410 [Nocardioides sp. BGMRC 2183]|nr:hypothetical protein FXB39_21410 [Nocardioides sp. BGMRC 2183]
MHRLRTLAATLTLACGLSLVLTACGDDEPTVAPAPTSEATSTATSESASDSPTVVPEDETAREFIERWIALANTMQQTGETSELLAVSGPDCNSCQEFARQVAEVYKNGGYIRGGQETVVSAKRAGLNEWVVKTNSTPTAYREASDAPVQRYDGGSAKSRFFLARVDGAWIVGESETVE